MTARTELRRLITEYGLDAYADDIMDTAQPAIRIERTRVADDAEISIGASKLGGSPDVPADFIWPKWNDTPLTFLAQFRLSDIAALDVENALPHSGYLYFFYEAEEQPWGFDPKVREFFRVIYLEAEAEELTRFPHPIVPSTYQDAEGFKPCIVSFLAQLTLPVLRTFERSATSLIPIDFDKEYDLSDADNDQFWNLHTELSGEEPRHYLLGYPDTIQADMRQECEEIASNSNRDYDLENPVERAELEARVADWRLLLQIDTDDSDDGFGGIWGDVGMLYFWIRKQDLAARDFSKSWMILQCS